MKANFRAALRDFIVRAGRPVEIVHWEGALGETLRVIFGPPEANFKIIL